MGHALNRGTFFDARGFAAHVEKYRKRFFRRPINWAMEKSILAAYTPPLRKDVRKPAGFPTPFGWAYPVLAGAVDWSGRRARGVRRVSEANLEVERLSFSSISRPQHRSSSKSWFGAETGEGLCPSPCPHPSQEGCGPPDTYRGVSEGERSEPGGRAFELAVGREATGVRAFGAANKPNGTPARGKAGWRGGSSISRPKHRSSSKSWFGAASEGERSEPEA